MFVSGAAVAAGAADLVVEPADDLVAAVSVGSVVVVAVVIVVVVVVIVAAGIVVGIVATPRTTSALAALALGRYQFPAVACESSCV